jgi:hypothetical protein
VILSNDEAIMHIQLKAARPLSFTSKGARVLQRKCACGGKPAPTGECESCRKRKLQRRSENLDPSSIIYFPYSASEVPPIVHEVLRLPGSRSMRRMQSSSEELR